MRNGSRRAVPKAEAVPTAASAAGDLPMGEAMAYDEIKLRSIWCELGDIEREVLLEVADGLRVGQGCYGKFDDNEERDMAHEALEEVRDALVYTARALVAGRQADD